MSNRMSGERFNERFAGMERLVGEGSARRIARSHVAVIGVGGVGSWVAEALARSGIGALTLVDMDDVCESNFNRQIHAVESEIGRPKVEAMARRIGQIHPECRVTTEHRFFSASTASELLDPGFDCVVDAIDSLRNKILLIRECRSRGIPLIVSGGAGGKSDPTRVRIVDLSRTEHDPLIQKLRKELRRKHGFPRDLRRKFGIPCVYSDEPSITPDVCSSPEGASSLKLDCESGYGTACFVTGAFGFAVASWVIRILAQSPDVE